MLTWRVDAECPRIKKFAYKRKIKGKMFAYMRKYLYLCIQKDGGRSPIYN